MAYTFTGCCGTPRIAGDNTTGQFLFALENGIGSGTIVTLRRMTVQLDTTAVLTSVTPAVRGYRSTTALNEAGVVLMGKGTFDTSQTSNPEVEAYATNTPDGCGTGGLTTTVAQKTWQKSIPRAHTLVEQIVADDQALIPAMCDSPTWNFKLYPGETYIVRVDAATAASNPVTNYWLVNCCWQEEAMTTFTVSGVVTLSGTGVVGAKVTVLVADDTSLTNAYLWQIVTTTAGGAWACDIPTGKVAYAYGQNYTGGTYYTAPGAPYIT